MRARTIGHQYFLICASIASIASIAVHGAAVLAQAADSTHVRATRIIGIYDAGTGAPVQGVQVRDAFTGSYAITTVTGTAPLSFLTYRGTAAIVELRKLGYQAKQVVLAQDDTISVTEVMEPFVELAPVVTTEMYRLDRDAGAWAGFEQRCQSRSVTCIRNEDLTKRPSANLADFLIHAPGVTIGACGSAATIGGRGAGSGRNTQCGKVAMHSLQIPPAYCEPTFFIDGFEWNSHIGSPTDLTPNTPPSAPYTPANVKAVEVYPPERTRPLRFEGNPTCGAVVIWTK